MYWQVKAVLIAALLLILGGVGYVFRAPLARIPELVRWERVNEPPEAIAAAPGTVSPGPAVAAPADPLSAEHRQTVAEARRLLAADNPVAARDALDPLLATDAYPRWSDGWTEIAELLSQANRRILMTDVPCDEKVTHTVKSGDSLWEIARSYNTTVGMVRLNNRIPAGSNVIHPGQTLKIYKGDWRILVSKEHTRLVLYDGDRLMRTWQVGIGRQDRTPIGDFVIYNKESEPVWNPPGRIIPYGDPDNVLGTRWMGIKPVGDTDPDLKGFGIHGTWAPESIGKAESNGCIRMVNDHVEELFLVVCEGTPVHLEE